MISITHSQAQRILRRALDRPAPGEQWTALQAHLESCAACRAYRDERLALERSLRRALRARWQSSGEASIVHTGMIALHREQRGRQRRALLYAGLGLALILLLAGLANTRRVDAPEPQAVALDAPAPTATPVETPPPGGEFQGVLAFEAVQSGNADIFLLEAGPGGAQLSNLTNSGARDFAPVWSPDGAWIAFLSNRDRASGGGLASGADIYVISVAGTRLTRLTADPALSWSGPLAWSPDGQWIAATGTRRAAGEGLQESSDRWIYRVYLDGSPSRALPYSRGGSQPRFSPGEPLLAYIAADRHLSFLRVYDLRDGRTTDLLRAEASQDGALGPGAVIVQDFDWSVDGRAILYTSLRSAPERDPNEVHLRLLDVSRRAAGQTVVVSTIRRASRVLGIFPAFAPVVSAGLAADDRLLYARSYWRGGRGPACRPLESAPRAGQPELDLPALCLQSPIERAAWSSDGRWLALAAQEAESDGQAGLYLLRLPDGGQTALRAERLIDLPARTGSLRLQPDRAAASSKPIEPRAAPGVVLELPAVPPRALLERALLASAAHAGWQLARLQSEPPAGIHPGGKNPGRLITGDEGATCPSSAPDGSGLAGAVAYTLFSQDSDLNRSDIYVVDRPGVAPRRLTRLTNFPEPSGQRYSNPISGRYECPSWSPDGALLAAWIESGGQSYLALVPAGGVQPGSPARYLPLNAPAPRPVPVWSADGTRLLLFLQPARRSSSPLAPVMLASLDLRSGRISYIAEADGWSSASQAALAPEGSWLAYTTLSYTPGGEIQASLALTDLRSRQSAPPVRLPSYDPLERAGGYASRGYSSREYGSLAWLDDHRLGLAFFGGPDGGAPPALLAYDLRSGALSTLAVLEEELISAAWSPDGRWALYSTPSGLWSLNIGGALERRSAPIWLSAEVAYEINWQ